MSKHAIPYHDRKGRLQIMEVSVGEGMVAIRDGNHYERGDILTFAGTKVHRTGSGNKLYLKFQGRLGDFTVDNFRPFSEVSPTLYKYMLEKQFNQSLTSASL